MSLDGTAGEYLSRIAGALSHLEPTERIPGTTAAVAVIFGRAGSFLLIRRADRYDDPWSGQVAFPGGRVRKEDTTFYETASRESREEVGLDLRNEKGFLGYMESFEPRNSKISVVPCIFQLGEEVTVTENDEVSSHRWVPLSSLSVSSREEYHLDVAGKRAALPAFRFGDYLVWGLTERILTKLAELAGIPV